MSLIRLTHCSCRIVLLASCAFAAGVLAFSTPSLAGCQSGSSANNTTTFLLSAGDCQATALGAEAAAVGWHAEAKALQTAAFGKGALAIGAYSTSIGAESGTSLPVAGATNLGAQAGFNGAGVFSTAVGAGDNGLVGPLALGDYSIAIGGSNDVNNPGGKANGLRSIAVGQKSVSADFGTSVGFNTTTAFASTAIGTDAKALGNSSSAFGRFAKASGTNTVALGVAAVASQPSSVALGSGSIANVANTVSVGTGTARRRIVNVAPAVANTDAVTFAQAKGLAAAAAQIANADLQREVAELRVIVKQQQAAMAQQQQEMAAFKARQAAIALQE
jgi:trimeric autotransporter adhesin